MRPLAHDSDPQSIRYRADVDGLRAIAVLSVVLFHLAKGVLPGGYLGVDMFFVLSGFLITAIIWREIRGHRFSVIRFYDRRIRRIMPALLLVLLVTTFVSAAMLLPADLIGYGRSLLATLAFSANIYFWRDTNYFSTAAEQKPLLHIWSLGVEEQFYLLFPIILIFLARRWPRRTLHAIAVLSLASLAANVAAVYLDGAVPAFFLLPTRAWELGVGAIIAVLPAGAAPRAASAAVAAWTGAVLIGIGIIHPLNAYGLVPAAVPAVFGTALLLIAGQQGAPLVNRLLQSPPLAFVGLISYSLYLWHWPIIVLGQYYLVRNFTLPEMAAATALMAACAVASWRYVEQPFRSRAMHIQKVRLAAGLGVFVLAVAATALLAAQGIPGRLNAAAAVINQAVGTNYRCPLADSLTFGGSRACVLNLPSRRPADANVILLGNSHAQMYAPVWASILQQRGQTGLLVPANGCLPTVQVNLHRECLDTAARNLREILSLPRAYTVIIAMNWSHERDGLVDAAGRHVNNDGNEAVVAALDDLIDRLHSAGKQVVLVGPIAEPGWDVASILSRQIAFGRPPDRPTSLPTTEFAARFGATIHHFESRRDIGFARPDTVQCPAERCYYLVDGRSLFADGTHIAAAELYRFRTIFASALPP
jgi:peptidoglycan/LPS O-acetylase OafA/YrhL